MLSELHLSLGRKGEQEESAERLFHFGKWEGFWTRLNRFDPNTSIKFILKMVLLAPTVGRRCIR